MRSASTLIHRQCVIPFIRYRAASSLPLALVIQLRKDTGASIQKCKEALENSNKDVQMAIEFLRMKGELTNKLRLDDAKSSKFACVATNGAKKVVISEVSCLTDFAAESELFVKFCEAVNATMLTSLSLKDMMSLEIDSKFSPQIHSKLVGDVLSDLSTILTEPVSIHNVHVLQGDLVGVYVHGKSSYSPFVGSKISAVALELRVSVTHEQRERLCLFGNQIARQVLAMKPRYLDESEIPTCVISKEKETLSNKIKNPQVLEKALKGHMAKFLTENCLMNMEWIIPNVGSKSNQNLTVKEVIENECTSIGINPLEFRIQKFVCM